MRPSIHLRRLVLAACLLVGFGDVASAAAEMSFRMARVGDAQVCSETCPDVIIATGQITNATPDRFLQFVEQNAGQDNLHAVVFLDSPGGGVLASMEFGTLLRKIGAAAVVARLFSDGAGGTLMANGRCYSACVYALMGARKRVIPAASEVGIHRMFAYEDSLDASGTTLLRRRRFADGDMRSFLLSYSERMGISPALVATAERTPSDSLHILTRGEIRRWHLGVPRL